MPEVRGVREAEDLSEAMTDAERLAPPAGHHQLPCRPHRISPPTQRTNCAPTHGDAADLDTLRIHDLPAEERAEVVQDLSRAQRRVEAIITALGQLASGQLAQAEDRELIDVTDMLDRVARENMRTAGGVEIVVEAADDLGAIWGWPGGLRLAVDNLVRNAVTHGQATRIVLAARRQDQHHDRHRRQRPRSRRGGTSNGAGRFSRGSSAGAGGSGLGLALVAQQAALHGGT
jgi:signal transduction histidine kinase